MGFSNFPPCWLARIDQFEIDRSEAKNPDYYWLRRTLLNAVVMRRVRDAPDEAASRYRNRTIGVEIGPAVHPPCTRQHQAQSIGGICGWCAQTARVRFPPHNVLPRLAEPAEYRRDRSAVPRPGG